MSVCLSVGAHVWESACFCASSFKSKCSLCLSGGLCVSAHVLSVSESTQLELCLVLCSGCSPLPLASFYTEIEDEIKTQVWDARGRRTWKTRSLRPKEPERMNSGRGHSFSYRQTSLSLFAQFCVASVPPGKVRSLV